MIVWLYKYIPITKINIRSLVICPAAYKMFTLHVTTQVAAIQAVTCITIKISYITHDKVKYERIQILKEDTR